MWFCFPPHQISCCLTPGDGVMERLNQYKVDQEGEVWNRAGWNLSRTRCVLHKKRDNFCGFKEENTEFLLLSTPRYSEQIMWFFWHWKHVIILIPFPRYLAGHPLNCLYVVQKNAAAELQAKSSKWSVLHQTLACLPRPPHFQLCFWHLPTKTKACCYITLKGIRGCCLFCSSDMKLKEAALFWHLSLLWKTPLPLLQKSNCFGDSSFSLVFFTMLLMDIPSLVLL